jgi:drug/metabolite transporter (DMT)-like permease
MRLKSFFELLLLGCMWGPSFLFIKLAVNDMNPFTLVASRITLGGLILFLILKWRRMALPRSPKLWGHFLAMGFFANSLPFLLIGFAEIHISSAVAGVINGLTPIMTALLAHFLLAERLTLTRCLGILLSTVGFVLLLVPHLFTGELHADLIGMIAVGIAALSYAIGVVYGRRFLKSLPPLVGPTGQLLASSLYLIPLAFFASPYFPSMELTWTGAGALMGLTVFGTSIAFVLYYRILAKNGAAYLAMVAYLFPVFSTLLGALFLDETLSWNAYQAAALILLGMMIVNETLSLANLKKLLPNKQKSSELDEQG